MSWSITVVGAKDALKVELEQQFDKAAKNYAGTEEEKDVLAVKERALAAVESFTPTDYLNGLKVDAAGSRYSGGVNFRLEVTPQRLIV